MRPPPPGATIRDIIEERGLSVAGVAATLHLDADAMRALLDGKLTIGLDLAVRLAAWSGASLDFWQRRERYYRHPEEAAWEQHMGLWMEDLKP